MSSIGNVPQAPPYFEADFFAGVPYMIQAGSWTNNSPFDYDWTITLMAPGCDPNVPEILCSPASPHYLGESATLAMSFVLDTPSTESLWLRCTNGPPGEFGYLLVSAGANAGVPLFEGVLCLDQPIGRYNPNIARNQGLPQLDSVAQFNADGVMEFLGQVPTSSTLDCWPASCSFEVPNELPFSPVGQVTLPGETWYFQAWFRDQSGSPPTPGTANFSDVLKYTFP